MIDLIQGDCLEQMKSIKSASIDMVLVDPPYGITGEKWDKILNLNLMWKELKRIVKPKSAICIFGVEPFSSYLRLSNVEMFKYDWCWIKNRPLHFLNAKLRPLSTYENISIFSDGKISNGNTNNMRYYPQNLVSVQRKIKSPKNKSLYTRPSHKEDYLQEHTNYPRDILNYPKDEKIKIHPTQKPVALLEYLIKTYTQENDTVLDFTMGSGSTGIAAIQTKRKFIGIELDEKYFNLAKNRIESIL